LIRTQAELASQRNSLNDVGLLDECSRRYGAVSIRFCVTLRNYISVTPIHASSCRRDRNTEGARHEDVETGRSGGLRPLDASSCRNVKGKEVRHGTRVLIGWIPRAFAVAAMAATVSVAHAQPPCGDHKELVAHLAEKYQERQYAYGTVGNVAIMEIYVSETGTWTVIMTDPAGKSCIMAAGDGWEATVTADLPGA
jgi:hypothetical protein